MNKRTIIILLVIVFLIGLTILYGLVSPTSSPFFPKCPFLLLTGLECPGCGSQRTIHALLNGRFITAIKTNPLVVLAIPYLLAVLYLLAFKNKSSKAQIFYEKLTNNVAIVIVCILYFSYFIIRNVF